MAGDAIAVMMAAMTIQTIDDGTGERRRIHNPVQHDAVTFLQTSAESAGERTLAELDVAPGGKVTPTTT